MTHEEAIQILRWTNEVCDTVVRSGGRLIIGSNTAEVIARRNREIIEMLEAEEDDGK